MAPDLSGKRINGNGEAADLLVSCQGSAVLFWAGSYRGHGWLLSNFTPAELRATGELATDRAGAFIVAAAAKLQGLKLHNPHNGATVH